MVKFFCDRCKENKEVILKHDYDLGTKFTEIICSKCNSFITSALGHIEVVDTGEWIAFKNRLKNDAGGTEDEAKK